MKDITFEARPWSTEDVEKTVEVLNRLYSKGLSVGQSLRVINNHRMIRRSPDAIRKKLHQFEDKYFVKENTNRVRGKLTWGNYFTNAEE